MTSTPPTVPADPVHSGWDTVAKAAVAGSVLITVILLAFIWPVRTSSVKDLPVDIVGAAPAVAAVTGQLAGHGNPVTLTTVADRDQAVRDVRSAQVYGALILPSAPGQAPEILVASAGSPVATQLLTTLGTTMAAASGASATVTDLAPFTAADPRGSGLGIAGLPLAMGGILGGALVTMLVVGHWRRAIAALAYAVLSGALLTLVLHTWLGVLAGSFVAEWAAISLSVAATAAVIVGLASLIGSAGIGVGALITLLIGNPLSGQQLPKEFVTGPWGEIGQYFVPGASGTLLKRLSYFPDAATGSQWLILAIWVAAGTVLILVGRRRDSALTSAEHTAG